MGIRRSNELNWKKVIKMTMESAHLNYFTEPPGASKVGCKAFQCTRIGLETSAIV